MQLLAGLQHGHRSAEEATPISDCEACIVTWTLAQTGGTARLIVSSMAIKSRMTRMNDR